MTAEELLEKVKIGLNITGTYQDETLKTYINDVKAFLLDAGVSDAVVNSPEAVGVIIRGVSDLWNYDNIFHRFAGLREHRPQREF